MKSFKISFMMKIIFLTRIFNFTKVDFSVEFLILILNLPPHLDFQSNFNVYIYAVSLENSHNNKVIYHNVGSHEILGKKKSEDKNRSTVKEPPTTLINLISLLIFHEIKSEKT